MNLYLAESPTRARRFRKGRGRTRRQGQAAKFCSAGENWECSRQCRYRPGRFAGREAGSLRRLSEWCELPLQKVSLPFPNTARAKRFRHTSAVFRLPVDPIGQGFQKFRDAFRVYFYNFCFLCNHNFPF